ncbi:hypothetical protein TWF694_000843 [Orbilia ellipsospora]|uniref:L-rhamnose-1-dehydrogenase n=1 Tax=Orbilia ellipsospora TaxID=2528407 RepID=A0AAV9XPS6_9PEZI
MSAYTPQPYPDTTLLASKAAAITGGCTGIGRAIVKELIHHGAVVAVNHLDDKVSNTAFESLKSEISTTLPPATSIDDVLISVPGDISVPETSTHFIAATVAKFGKLDIFVSNAGICDFHEFLSLPPSLYQKHRAVNMDGAYYSTQAAANQMKTQGHGGSIVGISSISALVGGAGQTHYTPTKAGVLSLMQSAACALGQYGIRCNAILPGTIRTQLNDEDLKDQAKKERTEQRIALGRLGDPSDIAGPVVFLASDLARYVSGAQILVDGGAFVNFQ